mgnify:CR=1 FL=1
MFMLIHAKKRPNCMGRFVSVLCCVALQKWRVLACCELAFGFDQASSTFGCDGGHI